MVIKVGKQICFTADNELAETLDTMAKKLQRSRSHVINMLLKAAVKTFGTGTMREAKEPTTDELLAMMRDMVERFEKRFQAIEKKLEAT